MSLLTDDRNNGYVSAFARLDDVETRDVVLADVRRWQQRARAALCLTNVLWIVKVVLLLGHEALHLSVNACLTIMLMLSTFQIMLLLHLSFSMPRTPLPV